MDRVPNRDKAPYYFRARNTACDKRFYNPKIFRGGGDTGMLFAYLFAHAFAVLRHDTSTPQAQAKFVVEFSRLGMDAAGALGKELGFKREGQQWFRLAGALLGYLGGHKVGRALVASRNQNINSEYSHLEVLDR
jgi:hypothetical protein